MSQKEILLSHFRSGGTITILQAIGLFRIYNLKARIEELRKKGHAVTTTMKTDVTGKKYAVYSMEAV